MAKTDRKWIPGKFVWFELVTREPRKAQAFYSEVLGWKTVPFPMGDASYDMVYVGDTMVGGYTTPTSEREPAHWASYVSVEDVDAAARAASKNGGKVIEAPADIPTVGRVARIADPQGAALYLFRRENGDPPDLPNVPPGHFLWNELHTTDPAAALAFYNKVVGFTHRSQDMGPGGAYHTISGGGVDRGGVTHHLAPGVPPHWLPYVCVEDPDGVVARARKQGGSISIEPADIPGAGRFAVMADPTGAALAVLKPMPRASGKM